MYLIPKVIQGIKFRIKKIFNPLHNRLLMFSLPNTKINQTCQIGKVIWGNTGGGSINIGKDTIIHDYACIMVNGGFLKIGENCSINTFCHINGNGGLKIGNNVRIAANTVIIPANHIYKDINTAITNQGETRLGVVIEEDVWIGAGVIILDGVKIGKGCVIGAGSVVNKSIPPMSVAVGVPAKIIKKRI